MEGKMSITLPKPEEQVAKCPKPKALPSQAHGVKMSNVLETRLNQASRDYTTK